MRLGANEAAGKIRKHVLICGGTGCTSSGSAALRAALEAELAAKGIADEIKIVTTGCFGLCALGPIMIVYPEGTFYSMVKPENIAEIVDSHLIGGKVVEHLEAKENGHSLTSLNDMTFYKKQHRVALHNCGVIDPENIEEYVARDGYQALAKVLTSMTREEVVQCMLDSGLRGRGGAGFPTGMKWKFAMGSTGKKYVACNADEGDPGAFMDRSVLEGDPHALIEAMAIVGFAIGADEGYVYVRAEYPIAIKRLQKAIEEAREAG
ncbi:MAG: NAD(P)H-dependent oxidoreductase subunit E, partial [Clostridia bacterium]|nr:NAD(P)H-dependent oxidoreductase subunit E [Clostridia bacterium]